MASRAIFTAALGADELRVIFARCTEDTLLQLTCVCKSWSALANERVLWAAACDRLWPGVIAASQPSDAKALYRRLVRREVVGTSERDLRDIWIPRVANFFPKLPLGETLEPKIMRTLYDIVRRYSPTEAETPPDPPTACSDLVLLWEGRIRGELTFRHVINLHDGMFEAYPGLPDIPGYRDWPNPFGLAVPIPELQSLAVRKDWASTSRSEDVMWLVHRRTGKTVRLNDDTIFSGGEPGDVPFQTSDDEPHFINMARWPNEGSREVELLVQTGDREHHSQVAVRVGVGADEDNAELGAGVLFLDVEIEEPEYTEDADWNASTSHGALSMEQLGNSLSYMFENKNVHEYFSGFDVLPWR